MDILQASNTHLPALFALYDEYDRPKDVHPTQSRAEEILSSIRSQGGEVFVAFDGEILGTYMIHICHNLTRCGRPFAVVENVICKSSSRRSGIGKALMRHAIEYAKQAGCYKILLQTGEERAENHVFYEACGFKSGKRAFQIRLEE